MKKLRVMPGKSTTSRAPRAGRPTKPLLGLDVGSHVIKLIGVTHERGGAQLAMVETATLPPDAVRDGEIVDAGAVVDALRELSQRQALPTRRVATAIGGRAVITKNVWISKVDDGDALHHAVQWEAEQHIPFDLKDVYLDYQVLIEDSDTRRLNVLVVAAKREAIDNLATLVQEAGFLPAVVDVDAFAAQNAIHATQGAGEGIEAILDIGAEFSKVVVLRGGVPLLTSNVTFGTSRLVDLALKHFPATRQEVHTVLAGSDASDELTAVVEGAAEDLSVAIERSLSYLDSRAEGDAPEVTRLIVCGGGACIPSLVSYLRRRHPLDVSLADPLQGMDLSGLTGRGGEMTKLSPLLTVGVGLALRQAA